MRETIDSNSLILHFYFIALNANIAGEAMQHLIHRVVQCTSTVGPLNPNVLMEYIRYRSRH